MIVPLVLVMDVHSIFSYAHHWLVQYAMMPIKAIEHLSDHVNSVDKNYEKFLIRMLFLKFSHWQGDFLLIIVDIAQYI